MNRVNKIVFSRTIRKVEWENTEILGDQAVEELKRLKDLPGNNMILLGSGTILTLLTLHGLIDEYQIMIDPVAIGTGTPIFQGIKNRLKIKLDHVKTFKSGVVLLTYKIY